MESEIEFVGLVTRSRNFRGRCECKATDGKTEYSLENTERVPGSIIKVSGVFLDASGFLVRPKEAVVLAGVEEKEARARIEGEVAASLTLNTEKPVCDDETARKLRENAEGLVRRLLVASRLGRSIFVRFHHDADGISGAFALSEFIRCRTYQQNSAVYSVRDAVRDLGNLHNESRPVMILLDFGSGKESAEGIQLLKAAGIEVIIIDHHPPDKKTLGLADEALSPWLVIDEERASRYSAGYIAAEMAAMCGVDAAKYAKSACAGDKSEIIGIGEEDRKRALVLDYLAANSSYGNNLEFYRKVLNSEELFRSLWGQAEEKISEAAEPLMRGAKGREANGTSVYVFDLDKTVVPKEFPNRSKVATRLFETLCKDRKNVVVLGTGQKCVIMRASGEAVANGADLAKLIEGVKKSMKDFVIGGGGHSRAAALRVREGYEKTIVDELVRSIGG